MVRLAPRAAPAFVCALFAAALGCAGGDDIGIPPESLSEAESPIINGTPDTTRHAVVTIAGSNSVCSGTIVHKSGSTGHALTAAHCGNPQYVLQGNDYDNPTAVYTVTDYLKHPNYNGQVYDFMMVRFTGAGSGTPVIPAMSPQQDNLASGTQVRHVGYGKSGPPPGQNNTIRRQILGSLSQVQSLTLYYNQPNGGPCSGDSGGPQLTTSGTELVAGVTSAGDPQCASSGYSGRVSAVYDTFIMAFINNAPIGGMNCDQCTEAATTGMGDCMGEVNACFGNNDCNALLSCFDGCTTQTCYQDCANAHPTGAQLYFDIIDCVCDSACDMECGMEAFCQSGTTPPPTTTTATASAVSSGSETGAGGAGAVATGAGVGGTSNGSGNGDGWVAGDAPDDDLEGSILTSSACATTPGAGSRSWLGWFAALGLLAANRRPRRRRIVV